MQLYDSLIGHHTRSTSNTRSLLQIMSKYHMQTETQLYSENNQRLIVSKLTAELIIATNAFMCKHASITMHR